MVARLTLRHQAQLSKSPFRELSKTLLESPLIYPYSVHWREEGPCGGAQPNFSHEM